VSPIDRHALVTRHDPRVDAVRPQWPLQLGNGSFAVAVDVTGLQTWPEAYPHRFGDEVGTLLGTMSQWGWHSEPPPREYDLAETEVRYETPRGPVPYVDLGTNPGIHGASNGTPAEEWLRNNPHRLQLARIGFLTEISPDELTGIDQHLDQWQGLLISRFTPPGASGPVTVRTAVHPTRDALGVVSDTGWAVVLDFPYGSQNWALAADWDRTEAHTTTLEPGPRSGTWVIRRTLDATTHTVTLTTNGTATTEGPHRVLVTPPDDAELDLVVEFSLAQVDAPLVDAGQVASASSAAWQEFWSSGATIDLSGTDDTRAAELERRIVLSQYLTRLNCAANLPPAEMGLLANSWRGKFHLEMHWWHVAHFALWGRPELVEPSLDWYLSILAGARATAAHQGYRGARWPKQVGPEGRESPSNIGTFLLWQQPHPIHLAELVVRAHQQRGDRARADELQARWAELVFASAEFMADVVNEDAQGRFHLGPPLVPAQESYGDIRARVTNPAFELTYWRWALLVANRWRTDLGLPAEERWNEVASGLVPPHVRDGVLTAIDTEPWTIRTDHPSMLAAYGVVPPVGLVAPEVVRATVDDVLAEWDWESTWGWDYPTLALTAARLELPEIAVDGLLTPVTKNEYGPNGHNRQSDRLPAYLPGNGGLLAAVAVMASGWDGGPGSPGFPASWQIRHEGFVPAPGPERPSSEVETRSSSERSEHAPTPTTVE